MNEKGYSNTEFMDVESEYNKNFNYSYFSHKWKWPQAKKYLPSESLHQINEW